MFLRRFGQVAWRRAGHGVGDEQARRIPAIGCFGGQPQFGQRAKQHLAGFVTMERLAGSVGALQAGCETDDGEPSRSITKRWHWGVPPAGMAGDLLCAIGGQARAQGAVLWRGSGVQGLVSHHPCL